MILVAVAWPYASGPRHLGHVAGFGIPSDIFARYHRMTGSRVLMVSGTDEHGTPNLIAADHAGLSPKAFVDQTSAAIRRDLLALGLSYDLFTRTTTPNHYRVVQDVFETLHRKGYVVRHSALGAFSSSTGRTLPDRYVEGTCPDAATTRPAAISATTAATNSTPSTSSIRGRGWTAPFPSSVKPSSSSSTCPPSPRR